MNALAKPLDNAGLLADLIAGKYPDARGRYGPFGGRYVPEILIPAIERLERGVREHLHAPDFQAQFTGQLRSWVGRPTALTFAERLSELWGAKVWLKREDLAHTGAHKITNAIGQALLAKRLGAKRVVAETGAGQHGVASAAACARLGLPCTVYMGAVDIERQAPNVGRMRLLGATVVPVNTGDQTLRAAIDEAMRAWVADPTDTYYLLGSAVGPHPYPYLVRELQAVIGREAREQMQAANGALPDALVACVGGGSNSIGAFHAFVPDATVEILGIEAGGRGSGLGQNAATLSHGSPGCTAWQLLNVAAGRRRADPGDALGVGGPGLPRGGTRARAAGCHRPRYLHHRERRGGTGGGGDTEPARGHPAGAGKRPRPGRCAALGARESGQDDPHLPVRAG